jgi:hypothetical protein
VSSALSSAFLAVDSAWINSVDASKTQRCCTPTGAWTAGSCALVAVVLTRPDHAPVLATAHAGDCRCVRGEASEAAYQGGGSMMTYKTYRNSTIMRVAGSATSAMRKPQNDKRVRNDDP